MLMLDNVSEKTVCVGMSGYGKTLYANQLILSSKYDLYFVFDHEGQFSQRNRMPAAFTPAQLLAQVKRGFVVFNPTEMFDDIPEGFEWFCAYVYKLSERLCGKKKLLFCDEIQDIVDAKGRISRYVVKIQTSGRNRGIDFLCCSLLYNMIHLRIRGLATNTVAFATQDPEALKGLIARGFNPQEVAALPRGAYIQRNKNTGEETRGKIF